jgi:hypothetical protein
MLSLRTLETSYVEKDYHRQHLMAYFAQMSVRVIYKEALSEPIYHTKFPKSDANVLPNISIKKGVCLFLMHLHLLGMMAEDLPDLKHPKPRKIFEFPNERKLLLQFLALLDT